MVKEGLDLAAAASLGVHPDSEQVKQLQPA
jgi:hypothetical protein